MGNCNHDYQPTNIYDFLYRKDNGIRICKKCRKMIAITEDGQKTLDNEKKWVEEFLERHKSC